MKKLLRAFEEKDISTVTSLVIQRSIDPNALIPDRGVSPFHLIVGNQSETFAFKVTKIFLRYGGDPNVSSSDGVTPTHVAAAWGRTRILHLLLVNGGDPWIQDDEKKNAFNYAFEEREWEAVEMLHHFQQMYSAANSKREFDFEPKFEVNLERVLVRKGEEMYAYVPNENETKSVTTQTQLDYPDVEQPPPSPPIHDKIKFFEANPISENKSEKHGWCKDFYQTSCEVMVHCDAKNLESDDSEGKKEENRNQIFVTTVQIDTTPPDNSEISPVKPQIVKQPEMKDMKSQLHLELQEAVRKRSLKMQKAQEEKKTESFTNKNIQESSTLNISGIEPFESNSNFRVSSLYGIRLQNNKLIKSISDVMSDFENSKTDPNTTIDLCNSSLAINSTYFTCGEESESDCRIVEVHKKGETIDSSSINVTQNHSNDSFVSVAEEYRYTDLEEGVDLVEKNLLVTPAISLISEDDDSIGDASSTASVVSSVPSTFSYASDRLRFELTNLGFNPGPIIKTTKKLYLKKLWRLKKNQKEKPKPPVEETKYTYPNILERSLADENFLQEIPSFVKLEEDMTRSFEDPKRKWREGSSKTSFNYLLLDSRVSLNLPKRSENMTKAQIWEIFLSAIFYVGKGKRTRPYAHLYQAVEVWRKQDSSKADPKIQRIIDIWKDNLGVVCLHVFQNIIPVEAYSREAAMIDAIGLSHLKNIKSGEYYGVASTWSKKNKIKLGLYLLYKAMLIFLNEGERQIRPLDIS